MKSNQETPFIVFWENDCGYGTDYYATEKEQDAAMIEIRRTGTEAWPGSWPNIVSADTTGDKTWT